MAILEFPRHLHQTWKTPSLPTQFQQWSASWKTHNPDFTHKLWTDKDNYEFVKEFYPTFLKKYEAYNQMIERVDAARIFYLQHHGGIYADLDFECLKPFDDLLEQYKEYDVILGRQGKELGWVHSLPNALMISKPQSDFWNWVILLLHDRAHRPTPAAYKKTSGVEWRTGPILLKDAYDSYAGPSKIKVLDTSHFYPLQWNTDSGKRLRKRVLQHQALSSKQKDFLFPDSYAVTYWAHSWGNLAETFK